MLIEANAAHADHADPQLAVAHTFSCPFAPSIIAAAGLDRPERLDASAPNSHTLAMQVHGGATMGRKDFHALAHLKIRIGCFDRGVFLGEFKDFVLRPIL